MDLKLKLLNQIHLNKSNDTHTTHQQLYDTLYESIILDQDALDARAAQSPFHKRSHDNHDPPNNRKGENEKKRRKDVGEPSSRSSRRTTWFDLFLKSDIDKDENHILGPSTNNDVELEYHVSQLKAAVLSKAQWNGDEGDVSKPISFERHMSKSTKPHPCFYNNDYTYLVDLSTEEKYTTSITKHYAVRYYKEGIEDMIPERWSKEVCCYHFEALNVRRSNEYEFSYADLPRLGVNDVEDMYLLQVQDKLHHLPLEFMKDFNNALLMFIRRTMIKNMVEDIQLGVESYERTLNLTKPTIDGTLVKIQENLIDMLSKNKLGSGNKRLKGRDWTEYDVKSSREMLKKIDEILRHRKQLRRLGEYVGGRPKTVNPRTFVRPL
ncbi:hypothetical protein Tco_1354899 [Tanacetum coccineum]